MFEAGQWYQFETEELEGVKTWSAKVMKVELPLISVATRTMERVLNAHAPSFRSAKAVEPPPELAFGLDDLERSGAFERRGGGATLHPTLPPKPASS